MGFEDYSVLLCPILTPELPIGLQSSVSLTVTAAILARWPQIVMDETSLTYAANASRTQNCYLVYISTEGLFQIEVALDRLKPHISIRFAYCNPDTIYEPFCEVIQWIMQSYKMECQLMRDLAPGQPNQSTEVRDPQLVPIVLLPSIEYNRRFWQLDIGSDERLILRPDEAIAHFVPRPEP